MRYSVLGPDGGTYGPVDLAGLQEWAREGRLVAGSVIHDEATGAYQRADQIPDLAPWLGAPPPPMAYTQPAAPCPNCQLPLPPGMHVCPRCGSGMFRPPERKITGIRSADAILGFGTVIAITAAAYRLLLLHIPLTGGMIVFLPIVTPLVLFGVYHRTYRAYSRGLLTGCFIVPVVVGAAAAFLAASAFAEAVRNFKCFG